MRRERGKWQNSIIEYTISNKQIVNESCDISEIGEIEEGSGRNGSEGKKRRKREKEMLHGEGKGDDG